MSSQPPSSADPPPTTTATGHPSQPSTQPPLPPSQAATVSPAQRTSEARTAFTASLHSAAANLDSDLQSRAKNIHVNAQALRKQEGEVEREVRGLRRWNEEAEGVVGEMGKVWGREMGVGKGGEDGGFDLGGIERELGVLEEWVRIVEEEDKGEGDEGDVREWKGKGREPGDGQGGGGGGGISGVK